MEVRLAVHFTDEQEARRFHADFPGSTIEALEDRNWAAEWQSQWTPLTAGTRFFLAPSWATDPVPPGRIRLEMRPGLVFGGGDHPTTRLCLELLEAAIVGGESMADIGCGTAILAQGAIALGAGRAAACDIDPQAVVAAIESSIPVFEGSVDALRSAAFDVIAANLSTGTLLTLMPEFARVLAPGGRAVLSGFLSEQREMVASGAAESGFHLSRESSDGEWHAFLLHSQSR